MSTQHLKLHPLTGSSDHDTTGLVSGQVIYLENSGNGIQSTGLYANGIGGITATTASIATLSGGTILSGSTNLYSIFQTVGVAGAITQVQPGTNTTTGGTTSLPTINLVASPSINNLTFSGTAIGGTVQAGTGTFTSLSAATLSGGTVLSGSTNLYSIFAPIGIDYTTASNGLAKTGNNITLGGALTGTTSLTGMFTLNLGTGTGTSRLAGLSTATSGTTTIRSVNSTNSSTLTLATGSTSLGLTSSALSVISSLAIDSNASVYSYGDSGTVASKVKLAITGATIGAYDLLNFSSNTIDVTYNAQTVSNNGVNNYIIITDMIGRKGAIYSEDYSALFTPESLITKRYVDNAVTGATGVIRKYAITTGFTSNVPKYINHNLNFSNSTDAVVQVWSGNTLTSGGVISAVTTNQMVLTLGSTGTYNIVIIG